MRPEYRPVTLVQLLSHRSGLPETSRTSNSGYVFRGYPSFAATATRLHHEALKDAPAAAPGSAFVYCNTGFLVAAVIAERAMQASFEDLMQREVFHPLGMTSVGFGPTHDGQPRGHRGGKPVTATMTNSDEGVPLMYAQQGIST